MNGPKTIIKKISLDKLFFLFFFLLTQSCSNSTIGKKLSDSFDDPLSETEEKNLKIESNFKTTIQKVKQTNLELEDKRVSTGIDQNAISNTIKKEKRNSYINVKRDYKFNPQEYRMILILKGVNPSAPSENVTRILLEEGIQFEVEKIEKSDDKNSGERLTIKRREL